MTSCRSCSRSTLVSVIDLGNLRVPDFRKDDKEPPRFPLELLRCVTCGLVQLSETAPREALYTNSYGFYSGVNDRTRSELQDIVIGALNSYARGSDKRNLRWLDIGCNDGTLLSFVPKKYYRVGVDPVPKFADIADQHADEIHIELFDPSTFNEPFDIVSSIAMFYDLDDPSKFVRDIASVLDPNGVWVVQQNDLKSMITTNAVDNISHEHVTYWSLSSFKDLVKRHGLDIVDVQYSDLNGGCMRCFVRWRDSIKFIEPSVESWISQETFFGIHNPETYRTFERRSQHVLTDLQNVIYAITDTTDRVYIYGASNRGSTLWQAARIEDRIQYAVERNLDKVGYNFSSIGVPIISEDEMRERQPEYLLIGPWWFGDMFAERERDYLEKGGALIIPLPEVTVIER